MSELSKFSMICALSARDVLDAGAVGACVTLSTIDIQATFRCTLGVPSDTKTSSHKRREEQTSPHVHETISMPVVALSHRLILGV